MPAGIICFFVICSILPKWQKLQQKPERGMTYMGKRLLTLCSWRSETSQLSTTIKDEATVDALWMCVHLAWSMLYR